MQGAKDLEDTGKHVVPESNGVVAQTPLQESDEGMVETTAPESNGVVAQTPLPEAEKPVVQIPYQIPVNSVSMPVGNSVWGTGNQGAAAPWRGHGGVPQTSSPQPDLKSVPASGTTVVQSKQTSQVSRVRSKSVSKPDVMSAQALRERCRQLCLSVFFHEQAPVRSLGFTSSLAGEGKTFLAVVMAYVLANDSSQPVTLLECNWEHPCLYELFGFSATPGLAEWLRGECNQTAICHRVDHDLTVIPAGDARGDAVKLLQQVRQKGLLGTSNGLWIVDLPAIVSTAYGSLAASMVESLVVVVHAGVTPDSMIAETCAQLKDLPVQGILLNQLESRIPRWIRRIL